MYYSSFSNACNGKGVGGFKNNMGCLTQKYGTVNTDLGFFQFDVTRQKLELSGAQ